MTGRTVQVGPAIRRHKSLTALVALAALIVLLILFWSWDWFIPIVDSHASAALGRPVSIQHLHVRLGRTTTIVADDVKVAGTDRFPAPLLTSQHLTIFVEILPLIRHFQPVLPLIDIDHPTVNALADKEGNNNWTLGAPSSGKGKTSKSSAQPVLGVLRIEDGTVRVDDPKVRARFQILVHTRNTPDPSVRPIPADQGQIVATAKGTYAGQPITGSFVGGAILSLRDKSRPYPVDLHVANGPTHVALTGTIEQPLTFGGAKLKLLFAGPDMSLLYPLTAVPIPQTPPYQVTGNLDYSRQKIIFRDFHGRVGSSDLNGTIAVVPGKVPDVDANLTSHKVDLNDLGGFIGSAPGSGKNVAATPTQRKQVAKAASSGDVLPTTPINMPKVRAANVHLSYKGERIEGRYIPLDDIIVRMEIQDGRIDVKQLDFGVGTGTIASSASLDPTADTLHTRAHIDFRHIDLSRLMEATHAFHGRGVIGGRAELNTTGNSVAGMLGHGDGGLTLILSGAGDISALLHDIAGLEFGNAILSAIGLPNRADLRCFVADLPLRKGILSTDAFLLQTSEARTVGSGTVDFRNQSLNYSLTTRSTHFSVGSLPGPINITGKLGSPSITPGAEVVARAGAATGLGIVLPPLALLPTIQFGVGEKSACADALTEAKEHPAAPPPTSKHTRPHHRR